MVAATTSESGQIFERQRRQRSLITDASPAAERVIVSTTVAGTSSSVSSLASTQMSTFRTEWVREPSTQLSDSTCPAKATHFQQTVFSAVDSRANALLKYPSSANDYPPVSTIFLTTFLTMCVIYFLQIDQARDRHIRVF